MATMHDFRATADALARGLDAIEELMVGTDGAARRLTPADRAAIASIVGSALDLSEAVATRLGIEASELVEVPDYLSVGRRFARAIAEDAMTTAGGER